MKVLPCPPHARTRGSQHPTAHMTTGLSWLDRKPRGYFSPHPPQAARAKAEMPTKRTSAPKAAQQPSRPPGPAPTTQHRAGNPSPSRTRARDEAQALHGIVDLEGLADRLAEQSGDQQTATILRPLLPKLLAAMVQGSLTPGPSGAADRAALAKLMGAPWAATAADRKGGQSGKTRDQGRAIGGRLEAALARKERALGAGSVTQDAAEGEEPSSDGLFGE